MNPRRIALALVVAALGAASAFMVACSSDTAGRRLSVAEAEPLLTQLDAIPQFSLPDECSAAEASVAELESGIAAIDQSVRPDLRSALADSAKHLRGLVHESCAQGTPATETQTTPTQTGTTPTQTGTTPTQTETAPPVTDTTPTDTGPTTQPGTSTSPGTGGTGTPEQTGGHPGGGN